MPQVLHLTRYGWRLYQKLRVWLADRGVFEERSEEEFITYQIDQQPKRCGVCLNCQENKKLLGGESYFCFACSRGAVK
jgi:hypothetical protein